MERSYVDALEEGLEPHQVLFGPAPCIRCGAWVEWAGAQVLNAGTRGTHQCAPFLYVGEEPEVIAEWTRPSPPRYAVMQAYPLRPVEPLWAQQLGRVVLGITALAAVAFAWLLWARYVA